jgi:hypothetical protein
MELPAPTAAVARRNMPAGFAPAPVPIIAPAESQAVLDY